MYSLTDFLFLIDWRLSLQFLLSPPMQRCLTPSHLLISDPLTSPPWLLKILVSVQVCFDSKLAIKMSSAPFTSSNITWTTYAYILEFFIVLSLYCRPFTVWLLPHRSSAKNTQNLREKSSRCSAVEPTWKISVKESEDILKKSLENTAVLIILNSTFDQSFQSNWTISCSHQF